VVIVKVYDILHVISVINQGNVTSEYYITVASGRWRQALLKVRRCVVNFPPQLRIQRGALTKPPLLIAGQAVLFSEPDRRMVLVLVIPVIRGLTVLFVELCVVLAPLIVTIAVLRKNHTAWKREKCR
jgi:hypothetical protein